MRTYFVLAIFLIFAGTAVWLTSCNNSKNASENPTVDSDSTQKVIQRGEYLAQHVAGCMDCHSKRDYSKYTGPLVPGTDGGGGEIFDHRVGIPGVLYGRNITPDTATGIGNWTDAELIRAITQGINKKGDTLFPLMPYTAYNRMAKEDLYSIIAFLRTLKPIHNPIPDRQLQVPIGMVYPAPALQPSIEGNTRPAESDRLKYGEYLVTIADCGTCHSPPTPLGPDMTKRYAGGYTFDLGTNKVVSANITPDSATGIGRWTEAMFLEKFTRFRDPNAFNVDSALKKNTIMPMGFLAGIKDEDLKSIYAYLRTIPPINHKVEKFPL